MVNRSVALAAGMALLCALPARSICAQGVGLQADDADYTAKIKQFTTEPYFLTELVDHLPHSDTVPSPDKVLGYVIGDPNHLTYTQEMYRYYRALEKATPRVQVFTAPERSEEGKEQILVVISDDA